MKCPMCDGRRTMFTREQPGVGTQFGEIKLVVCPKCNGTGEVDENSRPILTNEEWLKKCTTEQLAKVLYNFFMARTFCHICPENNVCDIGYKCKYGNGEVEDFIKWLKQPHSEVGK